MLSNLNMNIIAQQVILSAHAYDQTTSTLATFSLATVASPAQ